MRSKSHLDHEALDASVKDCILVVTALSQHQKIFTGAGRDIAVQLQVQVPKAGVQLHVGLLLGMPLYAHQSPRILGLHVDCRGCE